MRDRPAETMEARLGLTPRQGEVLTLLIGGLANPAIAAQLGISRSTLQHHIGTVYAALGVHTRLEVIGWAVTRGLLAAAPEAARTRPRHPRK
jgi:DNA-binding NarL/FixJ family response regulator